MKKNIIRYAAAAVAAMALGAGVAQAATVELALVIDESGSISAANWLLQKNAYAAALNNPSVLPLDGTVAIGVWKFDTTVEQVFAMNAITGGNIGALIGAINGMVQGQGLTAIGDAIAAASAGITAFGPVFDRQVIDVSTDGFNTAGQSPITARNNALAAGVEQVNGLGIGAGADLSFVGGVGSFGVAVNSFADFQAALERKIVREVQGVPDAGSSLALLGMGVLCLGAFRRTRAA